MRENSKYYKLEITRDGMEAYITLINGDFLNNRGLEVNIDKDEKNAGKFQILQVGNY